MWLRLEQPSVLVCQQEVAVLFFSFEINKKDMKPFHIDGKLECPILLKNVLSCLRTCYPV